MKQSEFEKLFPNGLEPNKTIPFVHKGKWAIHELLPFLLDQIGTAAVSIATFNVSEDSLRRLFFLTEEKKITNLNLLLDMNVKRHKLALLLFAANITPSIQLTSTHMKVLLVENDKWKIGVVGSANLNNNPRYEAGFIFTDGSNFDYFKKAYTEIFENDSLPYQWE